MSNFLQIDIFCSSAIGIVWDCKPALSVNFFNSIWPTKVVKMTVKIKICVKRKTKYRFVLILNRWWRIWPYFFRRLHHFPVKQRKKNGKNGILRRHFNTMTEYIINTLVFLFFLLEPATFCWGSDVLNFRRKMRLNCSYVLSILGKNSLILKKNAFLFLILPKRGSSCS